LAVLRGVYVFAYALLPFEFEGKKRFEVANHALKELESVCDVVICLQNDFLLNGRGHNVPQDTLVVEAFECAHKWIWNGIRGIIQVARGEGLLLGDQRALLNFLDAAKNEQCVFGVGSGAGKDCERVALEQLRQCPFFVLRNDWKIAHAVIVLRSGKDFTQVRAMECAKKITDLFGIGEQRIFCLEIDEHAQQVLDVYIIGIAKEQFRMGGRYCLYSEDTVGWELLVSGKQDVASWQEGLLREVDMDVPTYMRLNIPLSR
jgi:cell division protein FtsZ